MGCGAVLRTCNGMYYNVNIADILDSPNRHPIRTPDPKSHGLMATIHGTSVHRIIVHTCRQYYGS